MSDSIDPVLLDTYKLLLLRPGIYLGEEADTRTNRRRLLWMAAEMTILHRANEKFALHKKYDSSLSALESFNKDPDKLAWIEEETRQLRRQAFKKEFWKTWPMGHDEPPLPQSNDNDQKNSNPMAVFKGMKKPDESDAGALEDSPVYQEMVERMEEIHKEHFPERYEGEDAISFEALVAEGDAGENTEKKENKDTFPLSVPGVKFKQVHGEDILLEYPEDTYKPPVRVKMTLPDTAGYEGTFAHDVVETAEKAFGLKKPAREKLIRNLLAPLDEMTGLGSIKEHIETIVRMALITQRREKLGLPVYPLGGHMLFLGNPGTGKTHVARLLADILYKAGVLKHGQMVEVDRAALTGEYIGWTESKTNLVCNAAQGGLLFIDEAYALSDAGHDWDFGYEAINVLNKRMEDDADKFIVIAAGYKDKMETFLRSNPGLRSRFQHQIDFRDYTADEMNAIFHDFCRQYAYVLERSAKDKLTALLRSIKGVEQSRFGNARGVRNLFEKTIARQATRLMDVATLSPTAMKKIMAADIPAPDILYNDKLAYLPTKTT